VQCSQREPSHDDYQNWSGTAKHVFQVHGVDENEQTVVRRHLRRGEMVKFFTKLAPTRIGLEACGASHYWAPPIWAPRSTWSHTKAGHITAIDQTRPQLQKSLRGWGRPHKGFGCRPIVAIRAL
jgi:hypothetical protein